MSKKELRQLYGGRKPKSYLPAHNHVIHTPGFGHGVNGFRRFWIPPQWIGRGWSKCPCGWMGHRPEWKIHYAASDHVKWWKSEIKKRGSLEAVIGTFIAAGRNGHRSLMTIKQSDLPLVRPIGARLSPEALQWLAEVERVFPGTTKDIITVRREPASPTPRSGEIGNFSLREKV